jgi:GAF domain-containing protein
MEKERFYREIDSELASLVADESDLIARMSTICSLLKDRLSWVSWAGFYRCLDDETLVVGPYQGRIGCLRIRIGSGVCGTAAEKRAPVIVPDVHAFPGHIACDPAARSEIVLPVFDAAGKLLAVLDLDSHLPAAFDETDQRFLERLLSERVVGRP